MIETNGYFDRNPGTLFEKICSWSRYQRSKFAGIFLPQKEFRGYFFNEMRALTTRTCLAEQGMNFSKLSETLGLLWSHSVLFALEKKP